MNRNNLKQGKKMDGSKKIQKYVSRDKAINKEMFDKPHGCKLVRGPRLTVTEQGDNFDYYHSGRNEPVPPCPTFSSACKILSPAPPLPGTVAKHVAPAGVPLKDGNENTKPSHRFWELPEEKDKSSIIPIPFAGFRDMDVRPVCANSDTKTKEQEPELTRTSRLDSGHRTASAPSTNTNHQPTTFLVNGTNHDDENWEDDGKSEDGPRTVFAVAAGAESIPSSVTVTVEPEPIPKPPEELLNSTSAWAGRGGRGRGKWRTDHSSTSDNPLPTNPSPHQNGDGNPFSDTESTDNSRNEDGAVIKSFLDLSPFEQMVRVLHQYTAQDFMIQTTDMFHLDNLLQLEGEIFYSLQFNSFKSTNKSLQWEKVELKEFDYYALVEKKERKCSRVRLMSVDNVDKAAVVLKIDHGSEELVPIANLCGLKNMWKDLPQMCCRVRCSNFRGYSVPSNNDEAQESGKQCHKVFENRLETIKPMHSQSVFLELDGRKYMERRATVEFLDSAAFV